MLLLGGIGLLPGSEIQPPGKRSLASPEATCTWVDAGVANFYAALQVLARRVSHGNTIASGCNWLQLVATGCKQLQAVASAVAASKVY